VRWTGEKFLNDNTTDREQIVQPGAGDEPSAFTLTQRQSQPSRNAWAASDVRKNERSGDSDCHAAEQRETSPQLAMTGANKKTRTFHTRVEVRGNGDRDRVLKKSEVEGGGDGGDGDIDGDCDSAQNS